MPPDQRCHDNAQAVVTHTHTLTPTQRRRACYLGGAGAGARMPGRLGQPSAGLACGARSQGALLSIIHMPTCTHTHPPHPSPPLSHTATES